MGIRRRLAVSTVAALSLAGFAAVTAAPAEAAVHGSCGKGWSTTPRDKVAIKSGKTTYANVYVYVKSYPHSNYRDVCAIVRAAGKYTSSKHLMMIGLQFKDKAPAKEGTARYYVGPVKTSLSGRYRSFGTITIGKTVHHVSGPWRT
ncbi:hypothetical protein [Actinoallomurus sp. CA-150999]|uniref:hypothetical protein n=1 Tax=Actinoallomurus sp. CA-150999 TaxID=3239887 RepID=UPI003D913ED9